MIRIEEVLGRVQAHVPELAGRIEGAGKFAELIEQDRLPQQTPAGFVLPGGMTGGPATAAAGMFLQNFRESVIVVVVVRVVGGGHRRVGVHAMQTHATSGPYSESARGAAIGCPRARALLLPRGATHPIIRPYRMVPVVSSG